MFAHQAIEGIWDNYNNGLLYPIDIRKDILNIIKGINNSQKFHLEDTDFIIKTVDKNNSISNKFIQEYNKYIKLPYSRIWVDFPLKVYNDHPIDVVALTKAGILAEKTEKGNKINFVIIGFGNNKKWVVSPFGNIIDIESKISGVTRFSNSTISLQELLNEQKVMDLHIQCVFILLSFLVLLNCKNIITEKILAPERLNKKRRKSGKIELFDYHVLNIIIPSKKRGYSEKTTPLSHNRVHLCRGHFKEYTSEHPLFGKYTGLYWWQPHIRGQNRDGVVMKDYKIVKGEKHNG